MAAPIGNQHAKGNKGGSPGYGRMMLVREKVEQFSIVWWEKWEVMINSDDKHERIEAMKEFNKLQCRMIPQDVNNNISGELKVFNDEQARIIAERLICNNPSAKEPD